MPTNLSKKEIKQNLEFLKVHLPPKPTAVDGFYKLPVNFSKNVIETNFSQNSLQMISNHIGYFLGILKPIKINFVEEATDPRWVISTDGMVSKDENNSSAAGLYRVMGHDHSEIILIKKNRYQLKHVLAILAHEYTHHYLYQYGVRIENEEKNEILTEIASVYIGLGQFLVNGYKPITWTNDYYDYIFVSGHTTHTMSLGYVTIDTIKKAIVLAAELRRWDPEDVINSFSSIFDKTTTYFRLWPHRNEVKEAKKRKNEMVTLQKVLEKMKEEYKDICFEFDKISKIKNLSSISNKDSQKFIKLANEISLGNIDNKIKNLLDSSEDINDFDEIQKEAAELIDCITRWQGLLDKYIK